MPDEVEDDLLEGFVRGDLDAFESLFRLFEADVYRWILRIVRDPSGAEDVLVDAFWRAYRGRAGFDPSRSFGAWMRRIATNASLDHVKRERRLTVTAPLRDATMPAPPATDDDLTESIAHAFAQLSPKLHVVAALALIEDRPYEEIAEALPPLPWSERRQTFCVARRRPPANPSVPHDVSPATRPFTSGGGQNTPRASKRPRAEDRPIALGVRHNRCCRHTDTMWRWRYTNLPRVLFKSVATP